MLFSKHGFQPYFFILCNGSNDLFEKFLIEAFGTEDLPYFFSLAFRDQVNMLCF